MTTYCIAFGYLWSTYLLSQALLVHATLRENTGYEVRERWGETRREDGRAAWRGSLFHGVHANDLYWAIDVLK